MTFDALVDLCLAAHADALTREHNLAPADQAREAMASVLRVAAARSPGVAKYLETHRPATVIDALEPRRLKALAAPTIAAVAAEASATTGFDITPALLTGPSRWRVLNEWRALCWWRLSRQGMRVRQLGQVFGRAIGPISDGIRRHEARMRAARADVAKEANHG